MGTLAGPNPARALAGAALCTGRTLQEGLDTGPGLPKSTPGQPHRIPDGDACDTKAAGASQAHKRIVIATSNPTPPAHPTNQPPTPADARPPCAPHTRRTCGVVPCGTPRPHAGERPQAEQWRRDGGVCGQTRRVPCGQPRVLASLPGGRGTRAPRCRNNPPNVPPRPVRAQGWRLQDGGHKL